MRRCVSGQCVSGRKPEEDRKSQISRTQFQAPIPKNQIRNPTLRTPNADIRRAKSEIQNTEPVDGLRAWGSGRGPTRGLCGIRGSPSPGLEAWNVAYSPGPVRIQRMPEERTMTSVLRRSLSRCRSKKDSSALPGTYLRAILSCKYLGALYRS